MPLVLENHDLCWKGFKRSSSYNTPAMAMDMFHQIGFLKAPSNLTLKTSSQKWGIYSFSGQLIPASHHPQSE